VSCANTAKPIDLPFGLWTRVASMCPRGRAHWRHRANTIEPSVCCGDAVCQITLTACYHYYQRIIIAVSQFLESF